MAMEACKECGKDVSTSAKTCPECGAANPSGNPLNANVGYLVVLFLILALGTYCYSAGV